MAEDQQSFTHAWMRRVEGKLDALLEEMHDLRAEAAQDRSRAFAVEGALVTVQRRQLRADERLDDLARKVEALSARVEG